MFQRDFVGRIDARRGQEGTEGRAGWSTDGRQPFVFHYEPENDAFQFRLQFKKSHVTREELVRTLREILAQLEGA